MNQLSVVGFLADKVDKYLNHYFFYEKGHAILHA